MGNPYFDFLKVSNKSGISKCSVKIYGNVIVKAKIYTENKEYSEN